MAGLAGKRVLFIAPRFFGYENDIAAHFISLGAEVDFIPDRPFDSPVMAMMTRFARPAIIGAATQRHRMRLTQFARSSYDYIVIISAQTISSDFLQELRNEFPAAHLVLYMYDSMKNRGSVASKLSLFDDCLTFDPDDARQLGMRLRPLFFGPGFSKIENQSSLYDLSFIGTVHTDRFRIIADVRAALPDSIRCYWYLFLQAPWVFYAYKITNPAFKTATIGDFTFAPLPKQDVQEVFARSRVIFDIEHPRQTGLTMRTFETMGASKKLVTTNHRVRDYDFYDPNNICVIDRAAPVVPTHFLESPYVPIAEALYDKYSLKGWAEEVLGLESHAMVEAQCRYR